MSSRIFMQEVLLVKGTLLQSARSITKWLSLGEGEGPRHFTYYNI